MKNWLKKNLFHLCSACMIFPFVYYISSRSNFLFGEPEFPFED